MDCARESHHCAECITTAMIFAPRPGHEVKLKQYLLLRCVATNLCLTKYPLRSMNGIHEWMFLLSDELLMPLAKTCRHAYVGTMERLLPHVFQFSSDQLLLQKMLALQKMLLLSFYCTR